MLLNSIGQGARPDVMIGVSESFDDLVSFGSSTARRAPPSPRSVGIAVARGEVEPDISTVNTLVKTLLDARSVD